MEQTICAISTAIGESGIGIVRISGKNALEIGQKIAPKIGRASCRERV